MVGGLPLLLVLSAGSRDSPGPGVTRYLPPFRGGGGGGIAPMLPPPRATIPTERHESTTRAARNRRRAANYRPNRVRGDYGRFPSAFPRRILIIVTADARDRCKRFSANFADPFVAEEKQVM